MHELMLKGESADSSVHSFHQVLDVDDSLGMIYNNNIFLCNILTSYH